MEELKNLLTNPFDGKEDFQAVCEEIARKLFSHYCINCNGKEYYFAEIEFYYRNEEISKWNNDWNKVTYSNRTGYEAGSLFYHLSGVDICFECTEKRYGGILIRSASIRKMPLQTILYQYDKAVKPSVIVPLKPKVPACS